MLQLSLCYWREEQNTTKQLLCHPFGHRRFCKVPETYNLLLFYRCVALNCFEKCISDCSDHIKQHCFVYMRQIVLIMEPPIILLVHVLHVKSDMGTLKR